jgi:hypothetical protein
MAEVSLGFLASAEEILGFHPYPSKSEVIEVAADSNVRFTRIRPTAEESLGLLPVSQQRSHLYHDPIVGSHYFHDVIVIRIPTLFYGKSNRDISWLALEHMPVLTVSRDCLSKRKNFFLSVFNLHS